MKTNISKHLECSEVYLKFSDKFKLNDIPDNTFINILDNVENRLLKVYGGEKFIIIRRIFDN